MTKTIGQPERRPNSKCNIAKVKNSATQTGLPPDSQQRRDPEQRDNLLVHDPARHLVPKSQSAFGSIRTNGLKHDFQNKNFISHEMCSNWAKMYKPKAYSIADIAYLLLEIDFRLLIWV